MNLQVTHTDGGPRLVGTGLGDVDVANRFLTHLGARGFSPATVRAYAFDVLNFFRFCASHGLTLAGVRASDLFDYLDWQSRPVTTSGRVVRLTDRRGAAPATMNRRIAAVRALFTYLVIIGDRADSPVPAARGSSGLRATRRGLLGHLGPGRARGGGQLVRAPRRLPESLEPADVSSFLADLSSYRDRAIVLLMLFGGLRSAEVRGLRLERHVVLRMLHHGGLGEGLHHRVVPDEGETQGRLVGGHGKVLERRRCLEHHDGHIILGGGGLRDDAHDGGAKGRAEETTRCERADAEPTIAQETTSLGVELLHQFGVPGRAVRQLHECGSHIAGRAQRIDLEVLRLGDQVTQSPVIYSHLNRPHVSPSPDGRPDAHVFGATARTV